ncbi:interactor of HORMAD1 protein 1 isoform X1 [Sminthopsis crassicaudata]|uniref:interactor of HORMAD1 protein 1 isoform X1 n=1 Tax=Sminthopsis crassicaudata TaxID=9301 RepID=UPI003D68A9B3
MNFNVWNVKEVLSVPSGPGEMLSSFISNVRENFDQIQRSLEKLEEELVKRNQTILDSVIAVIKTLQDSIQARCDLILEALQEKSRMEQRVLEMEKQFEIREKEFLDLKSTLKHLEVLAAEQNRQQQKLCDQLEKLNLPNVLAEMYSLVSKAQSPFRVKDEDSQIFPALHQASRLTRKGKSISEYSDKGETILLPPLDQPSSSCQREKWSAKKQEAGRRNQRHYRNTATFWLNQRGLSVQDEAVQTDLEPQAPDKKLLDYCDSSGYSSSCKRDLMIEETSQSSSVTMKDLIIKTRPTYIAQECQPEALFCSNTHDQNKELEQKDKVIDLRKRIKRKKPRKFQRRTSIRRKSSGLSRVTSAFSPRVEDPQFANSGQEDIFLGQVEDSRQPLPLLHPYKTLKPVEKGRARADSPAKAANKFFCDSSSPFLNSSEGDKQMRWFSDLNSNNLSSPHAREDEKSTFYTIAFDSSDDEELFFRAPDHHSSLTVSTEVPVNNHSLFPAGRVK